GFVKFSAAKLRSISALTYKGCCRQYQKSEESDIVKIVADFLKAFYLKGNYILDKSMIFNVLLCCMQQM
ncbi:MAG: hypothetical protein K2L00_03315, partial [Muribaculaceae bacterium]|nr:hypothetical protein [Muribaculaceae bacterium]